MAICFGHYSFSISLNIWSCRIKGLELTLALVLPCTFPTRQEGTTPWFNSETLPFQKSSVPKHLLKNDSGDNSEDDAEILLEMFLAHNFSHAVVHLTVNL